MAKTFKELLLEKMERMAEAHIEVAFGCRYNTKEDKIKHLKEIEAQYNAAIKLIEDNFE